jgi:hypothetical protein
VAFEPDLSASDVKVLATYRAHQGAAMTEYLWVCWAEPPAVAEQTGLGRPR